MNKIRFCTCVQISSFFVIFYNCHICLKMYNFVRSVWEQTLFNSLKFATDAFDLEQLSGNWIYFNLIC